MDYEKVIHTLIDPMVEHPNEIIIRQMPSPSDRDVTILICADDNDTKRLIGKRGVVANALREVIRIGTKAENSSLRIHLKFESFQEEGLDGENA